MPGLFGAFVRESKGKWSVRMGGVTMLAFPTVLWPTSTGREEYSPVTLVIGLRVHVVHAVRRADGKVDTFPKARGFGKGPSQKQQRWGYSQT